MVTIIQNTQVWKKLALLFLLPISSSICSATVCVDKYYHHPHLTLHVCQNYSNYKEVVSLLYQARAIQLEQFIRHMVVEGKLKNKRIVIDLYDPLLTSNYLHVSQNKNGYYIEGAGYLDFRELAVLINYFGQKDWESFVYEPKEVKDLEQTKQKLWSKAMKYPLPEITQFLSSDKPLWKSGSTQLFYGNDSLYYSYNGQRLPYKATLNLPVRINDRYLFFQRDSIYVFQNGATLIGFKLQEIAYEDLAVFVYKKWVNIGWSANEILYAYSYDKNKFFALKSSEGH